MEHFPPLITKEHVPPMTVDLMHVLIDKGCLCSLVPKIQQSDGEQVFIQMEKSDYLFL